MVFPSFLQSLWYAFSNYCAAPLHSPSALEMHRVGKLLPEKKVRTPIKMFMACRTKHKNVEKRRCIGKFLVIEGRNNRLPVSPFFVDVLHGGPLNHLRIPFSFQFRRIPLCKMFWEPLRALDKIVPKHVLMRIPNVDDGPALLCAECNLL